MDNKNNIFMARCLQLAQKGKGRVAPNPMVGAVIVYNNEIIGEGYHEKYGESHAEVNAINSVNDKVLLSKSTIYVSLEPCAHFGKTPPCSDLIISHNIPNVVIGMQDPFSKVNGLGIQRMKKSGCNITVGVLEDKCWDLNKEFNTFHTHKRPFIILKWAQTLDGFIDKDRDNKDDQRPNWITNEICRSLVHKWRTETLAIMVGTNTANIDNPKLNIRSWAGNSPLRIVIDRNLTLPKSLDIFDQKQPTLVLNSIKSKSESNIELYKIEFDDNFIKNLMALLYKRNITNILIEGGAKLLTSFINEDYWDEARVFIGNTYFNKGITAPKINGGIIFHDKLRDNQLTIIKKHITKKNTNSNHKLIISM